MDEIFTPERLENWKSIENYLLNKIDKSVESIHDEIYEASLENFNDHYSQDPLKIDNISFGIENYKYQMLMKNELSLKIENIMSKAEVIRITNEEKEKSGTPFFYNEMYGLNKDFWNTPKFKKDLLKYCSDFIVKNLNSLSCRGPSKKLLFTTTDQNRYFDTIKMKSADIKKIIKNSDSIDPKWSVAQDPMYMSLAALITFYYLNQTPEEKKMKLEKSTPYLLTLFSLVRMYSYIQHKYFKYGADEEEMDATIENMNSRFLFKGMKNIFELLQYIAYSQCENFLSKLKNPVDFNLYYYMNNLISQLNYMIKTISNQFYENREKNKGVSIQDMQKENPENSDKYLTLPDSISNDIEIITRRLIIKFTSEADIDDFCLSLACKQTGGQKEKIRVALLNMKKNDSNLLANLIRSMLAYYLGTLKQKRNTIKSSKFITLMKKVNAISNTVDPFVLDIKATLDLLLERNSEDFRKTSRKATLSVLRSTIYFFKVFYICKYSEG